MPETVITSAGEEQDEYGLEIAADILHKQVFKRVNLPGLLAAAAMAGYREEALEALIAWGTGKSSIDDIWEEISPMAQDKCVMEGVKPSDEKRKKKAD